jgi:hypothetical protein
MLNAIVMVAVTVFLQWKPEILVGFFTAEETSEVGATFLRTIVDVHRTGRGVHVLGMFRGSATLDLRCCFGRASRCSCRSPCDSRPSRVFTSSSSGSCR